MQWIGLVALTACAVILNEPLRGTLLVVVMLFYPLLDRAWYPPIWPRGSTQNGALLIVVAIIVALLGWRPHSLGVFAATLLWAALPEEWFFRGYLQSRLGDGWLANLIASSLFALLHAMTRGGVTAVLVFVPSLAYGWLYQRTRNLPLVVLVHALSNLVYLLGFGAWIHRRLAMLYN